MASGFRRVSRASDAADFVGRSAGYLWPHEIVLVAIAVGQQALFKSASAGAVDFGSANLLSAVLTLSSFLVLAWMGFDSVARGGGDTFTGIAVGGLFFPLAQLAGVFAAALLGQSAGVEAIVFSLVASILAGAVFSGAGAVFARLNSVYWLKGP